MKSDVQVAARPGMGIATAITAKNKETYKRYLDSFVTGSKSSMTSAVSNYFHKDAEVKMGHPVNEISGSAGYNSEFLKPLMHAFAGLQRQNYVMIGGEYFGGEWVTSTGYFYGHFVNPLFGIPPSGKTAFLRYGEFLRIQNGKVVEAECYLGLAELVISGNFRRIISHVYPLSRKPSQPFLVGGRNQSREQWPDVLDTRWLTDAWPYAKS